VRLIVVDEEAFNVNPCFDEKALIPCVALEVDPAPCGRPAVLR
jgi:hypothetical protein